MTAAICVIIGVSGLMLAGSEPGGWINLIGLAMFAAVMIIGRGIKP